MEVLFKKSDFFAIENSFGKKEQKRKFKDEAWDKLKKLEAEREKDDQEVMDDEGWVLSEHVENLLPTEAKIVWDDIITANQRHAIHDTTNMILQKLRMRY